MLAAARILTRTMVVGAALLGAAATGCGSNDEGPAASTTSTTAPSTATIDEAGVEVPLTDAEEFLACVKERESGGDYAAVGPGGLAFGAYQLTQDAWDETTAHAGFTDLEGIQPNLTLPADQDKVAMALLEWKGEEPWTGSCTWPPGTGPGSGGPGDTSGDSSG